MPALKLFISHSCRLRPADVDDDEATANWQLLQATCTELATAYGDRVEILVDYDGLQPSDDWERRLNEWLAECHAAIILFSRRAIEGSNWVKKEAAILSWRAGLEPGFKLFPVLLDQQATPEDLEGDDFFASLAITRAQCVQNATTAEGIRHAIRTRLDQLLTSFALPQTPFERLREAVATVISEEVRLTSLEYVWTTSFPGERLHPSQSAYADALSRKLLNDGEAALACFQNVLDNALPHPQRERAEELLKFVRALWVDAGAAGLIAASRTHGKLLALNGRHLARSEPALGTCHFTLDRYLERAWPATARIRIIPVSQASSGTAIEQEIRATYARGMAHLTAEEIDRRACRDSWHVVVFVATAACSGEIPDPRLIAELKPLQQRYPRLIFAFGVGVEMSAELPDGLWPLVPHLSPTTEDDQLAFELDAQALIDRIYRSHR